MASTHTKKKTISKDEWEQRLSKVVVEKQLVKRNMPNKCTQRLTKFFIVITIICRALNQLIMNYLVIEGYMEAAEQFSQESGLSPCVDLQSIQERREIRHAVQSGDIDAAIDLVNDLNPEVSKAKYTTYKKRTLI